MFAVGVLHNKKKSSHSLRKSSLFIRKGDWRDDGDPERVSQEEKLFQKEEPKEKKAEFIFEGKTFLIESANGEEPLLPKRNNKE